MVVDKISLKLFIASSSELRTERDRSILILFLLNKAFPHLHLEPVMWEYDLPKINHPGFNNLQEAINTKLEECKLATFIFYSKLGPYTREEFDYAMQKEMPSFVFFKTPSSKSNTSTPTYRKLSKFRKTLENKIAPIDYNNLLEFEYEFYKNLNLYLAQQYSGDSGLMLTIHELQKTLRAQEEAKVELEKQLGTQVQNDKLKALALAEMKAGNYDAAEDHLKQSARDQIQNVASTYIELGKMKELQLLYQEAYEYYDLAAKLQPDNIIYLSAAGVMATEYLGLYDSAKDYFEKALALQIERNEIDQIPNSMHNLAHVYDYKGEYAKALNHAKDAIKFIETHKIKESSTTAVYYIFLGHIHTHLKKFDEAIKWLEIGLEKARNFFLTKPSNLALVENDLGNLNYNIGKYTDAVQHYQSALSISTKLYGEKNLDVMIQYTNLALSCESLARTDLAIEYLEKALSIANQLFPKENRRYIFIYRTYGSVLNSLGDYDKAIKYLDKAHELIKKFSLEYHPDSADTYFCLAIAWRHKGDNEKDLEYLNSALQVSQKSRDESLTVELYFRIADTHVAMHQYSIAIKNYEKALIVWQGKNNRSDIALCHEKIGICFYELKEMDTALKHLENAINIRKTINQDEANRFAYCYLALCYQAQKQYPNAIEHFKNTLDICIQTHGEQNSNTISFYYQLGQCSYDNKEYMNAIKYYQKALHNTVKLYEKETGDVGIYYNNIGLAWSKLDEKNKAVENYRLALPILRKYFPPGHSNIQACEKNLDDALKT